MLSIAREARGLTQSELVQKVPNLTQGNYSRMEKGLLPIPDETLNNVALALNFKTSFFEYNKPLTAPAEFYYRKRATMPRKPQIKLEATFDLIKIWIDNLLHSIEIPDFKLPPMAVQGVNTPEEIARKTRQFMNLPRGPIEMLVKSIEAQGVIVFFLKDAPEKFDGIALITMTGQRVIIVNDHFSNDRKRYTIVHELGHLIMHHPFSPIADPDRNPEKEADRFASEFLMPELEIRRDLVRFRMSILADLKRFWKVSKAALIRRAYDLHYVDKSKYTNMMIELSRLGERKTEREAVDLDPPTLLTLVVESYRNVLEYSNDDLLELICITSDDFDHYILGMERNRSRFKIVL